MHAHKTPETFDPTGRDLPVEAVMCYLGKAGADFLWYVRPDDAPANDRNMTGMRVSYPLVGDGGWTRLHMDMLTANQARIVAHMAARVAEADPPVEPGTFYRVRYIDPLEGK